MNAAIKKDSPTLTGILIQDPDDNGYTGYFAEFPEVVAEGNNEEEAKHNLISALKIMLEVRRSEMTHDSHNHGKISSFELDLAI